VRGLAGNMKFRGDRLGGPCVIFGAVDELSYQFLAFVSHARKQF
jgi:hypothetical protein